MSSRKQSNKPRHKFERRREPNSALIWTLIAVVVLLLLLLAGLSVFLMGNQEGPGGETGGSTAFNPTDSPQPETTLPDLTEESEDQTQPTQSSATEPSGVADPADPTEKPTDPTKTADPTEKPTDPTKATEAPKPTEPEPTKAPTPPPVTPQTPKPTEDPNDTGDLTVEKFASYSGQFVEDGKDEPVSKVLSMLITNDSGKYLDFATLTYECEGKTATFVVTGLPAGRSAWVMEVGRMKVSGSPEFKLVSCVTSYRDSVIAESSRVDITANGNMLTAKNTSDQTLEDVFVYYKVLHTDGNFLGGVTYRVDFGTLAPGESAEVLAGHYSDSTARIVRIGWKGQ